LRWRWSSREMNDRIEHQVFLGLGSNLGDRRENLLAALRLIDGMEDVRVLEVSAVYETRPWGLLEQPDFLNLVALVASTRDPYGMLDACREVEEELGRVRTGRWGPRQIDADILLYDDLILEEEELIIPHPHMWERDFVMVPLLELRPDLPLPDGKPVSRHEDHGGGEEVRLAFRYEKEEWHV
jgi:2-amino-4-hydroxy-6-hydroxymethyldihydropteridine diphosphokinase